MQNNELKKLTIFIRIIKLILVVGLFIAAYDLYVITPNPVYIEQFID